MADDGSASRLDSVTGGRLSAVALSLVAPACLVAVATVTAGHASLWADEVATWSAATRGWGGLVRLVSHQDAVFAVYYAAMHLWTSIAGVSPLVLRLPSVLAAAATVVVTARLARRLTGNRWAGLTAGGWLSINPFFVFYAATARPYALLALLSAYTTDLVLRADPTRSRLMKYGVLCTVGVYLHLFFGLLVVAHVVGLTLADTKQARRFLPAWTAAAVTSAPLLVVAVRQRAQINWIPKANVGDYQTWWGHLVGHGALPALVFAALAVAGATGGRLGGSARGVLACGAVLGSVALITVSWWWPTYDSRYVIESTPAIAVLVSAGMLRLTQARPRVPGPTRVRALSASGLAFAIVPLCVVTAAINVHATWTHQRKPFFYENLAAASESLRDATTHGAGVIFLPAEARGSLYYYLDRDQDGDLAMRDLTAAQSATPLGAANFSGLNRPLTQTLAAARSFRELVLVELGPPAADVWRQLAASLHNTSQTRQNFGGLTLVLIRRR